ncbi:MAG: ribosomal L7Ae/L30e/S12e/Gadd45 family protein [Oscillospiraceae bacterium]|nr:ribosomal L7Ae/L30e/S12e/Gadd45 family protein [Oscillospiraceae bacterium]MCL2278757.1 ribosomal L7Ae/L30e/S12e/Gadd45 family protein [Oscillospiraceae bacterium]
MDRILNLLGIAKKAGKLAIGSEAAAQAVQAGSAALVITASDASDGSKRRAKANTGENRVEYLSVPYTKFELGNITGRGSPGTVAILDKGLANSFSEKLKLAQSAKESDAL